jgi:hypothetical protein
MGHGGAMPHLSDRQNAGLNKFFGLKAKGGVRVVNGRDYIAREEDIPTTRMGLPDVSQLYHGMPHPQIKGLHWYEHPHAVGGGFWSDAWDKIKNGARSVYDNVLTPIGHIARGVVAPVGNALGTMVGVPFAGTLADQGLKLAGLGRRRKPLHPHGMPHPHFKGIHFVHHPHAYGGGFWSDAWDKIKQGANWVGDKARQGAQWVGEHISDIAPIARQFVEPVGNFIGNQVGIENAGTKANAGLSAVGLGRRRRGGAVSGGLYHHPMMMSGGDYGFTSHIGGGTKKGQPRRTARGGKSLLGVFGDYMGKKLADPNSFVSKLTTSTINHAGDIANFLTKDRPTLTKKLGGAHSGGSAGDKRKARGALLSKIMAEAKAKGQPMTLPQASRYIKEHGLM